jgi:hypothetical protein
MACHDAVALAVFCLSLVATPVNEMYRPKSLGAEE